MRVWRHKFSSLLIASQPRAVEAGWEILRRGGNAMDAAISAAFAQGVVDPLMGGLGGFGSMLVFDPRTRQTEAVQFSGTVGSGAHPAVFQDDVIRRLGWDAFQFQDDLPLRGYKSVTVPANLRGFHAGFTRWGSSKVCWADVLEPAIRYASGGVAVHPYVYACWNVDPGSGFAAGGNIPVDRILTTVPATAAIYTHNGRPLEPGTALIQCDMARTLEYIANEGPDVFYKGAIGQTMARDFERNGGFITSGDLGDYSVRTMKPVEGTYRSYTLVTNGPPDCGYQVLQVLKILEDFDLASFGHNTSKYIRVVSQALKLSFRDRANHLADPDFATVPVDRLTSKAYCRAWAEKIADGQPIPGPSMPHSDSGTTCLVAADAEGMVVALTHSLSTCSGVVTPGLGFLYNNHMGLYWPFPGHQNSIEPGKRRPNGIVNIIVFKNGRPHYVACGAGGWRITSAVVQCVLNIIDHKLSAPEAAFAPRFHCQGDTIYVEATISPHVCRGLEDMNYHVSRSVYSYETSLAFANVQSIFVDDAGKFSAGPDPRGGGGVAIWE